MKKVILLTLLFNSACASTFFTPYDDAGRLSLSGDEKGLQAFSDMLVGLTNEARTPAGQKGSYYQLREEQVNWKAKFQTKYGQKGGQNE